MMPGAPEVLVAAAPLMAVVMAMMAAEARAEMLADRGGGLVEQGNRLSRHGKGDEGDECERRTSPSERAIEFAG